MTLRSCKLVGKIASALFLVALAAHPCIAIHEFQKLTASDAAANDNFGFSVGISGNTAIVGAWKDDRLAAPGENTGSAYIFRDNGSGNWTQADKVIASDALPGSSFGSSVALSGDTAVIGSLLKSGTGGAYIFKDNGSGDFSQIDILSASDGVAGDEFGYSAAISGNTAIVGAWKHNSAAGAAYVFRDNGSGDWTQVGKLIANDAMAGDHFGVSVAISGTTAMVGAYFDSNTAGPVTGATYVFQDNAGTWTQVDKLLAGDASAGNQFGASVAISGNIAVIGATGDATHGAFSGAAYVFQRNASMVWQQVDKIIASDAAASDQFGFSVGVHGNSAVVGAYQDDDAGLTSGSAYLFRESTPGNWNQVDKFTPSDGAAGDGFGYSVAIGESVSIVGSALANSAGTDAGAAYMFNNMRIAGDYNANGAVDAADFVVWRKSNGQSGTGLDADGNGDGMVNESDYQVWRTNFNRASAVIVGSSLGAAAVPEPTTVALFLLAAALASAVFRPSR